MEITTVVFTGDETAHGTTDIVQYEYTEIVSDYSRCESVFRIFATVFLFQNHTRIPTNITRRRSTILGGHVDGGTTTILTGNVRFRRIYQS